MVIIRSLILLGLVYIFPIVSGQISGTVVDANNGQPIGGVSIILPESHELSTNLGNFSIPAKHGSKIIFRHLSYVSDTLIADTTLKIFVVKLRPLVYSIEMVNVQAPYFSYRLIEMPVSISYLGRKSMSAYSGLDLSAQLNSLPGVYMHSGSLTTSRIIIRGTGSRTPYGSNRIKAFIDDIPLTFTDGTTVIEDLPPFLLQSVTILKGSKSAMYGSGLGGVILLKSQVPTVSRVGSNVHFEAGSFGSLLTNASFSLKKNIANYLNLAVSRTNSEGFRENSKYERQNIILTASGGVGKNRLKVFMGFTSLNAQIPSSVDSLTFQSNPKKAAPGWLAVKGFEEYTKLIGGISFVHSFSELFSSTTIINTTFSNGYESRPFNILDDTRQQAGIKTWVSFKSGNLHIESGFEGQSEKYVAGFFETNQGIAGPKISDYFENRLSINFFVESGYSFFGKLKIETGANLNKLYYEVERRPEQPEKYSYRAILSPFIGLNYSLAQKVFIYTSAGQGFSHPSAEETILPHGAYNNKLIPESGYNFDLGARANILKSLFYIDIAGYLLYIDDMLVTSRLPNEDFFTENSGSTINKGIEMVLAAKNRTVAEKNKPIVELQVSSAVSYNHFRKFINDGTDFSGNQLPGVPGKMLHTQFALTFKGAPYLIFQSQWFGKQYLNDSNSGTYSSYLLLNTKIGYKAKLFRKAEIEIYAGAKNLSGKNYASMVLVNAPTIGSNIPRYYYPGTPRYFFAGLGLSF
ncbi:MAG: TonB-dependent receptor plug domain-containing protein [Bacteroidales bacterium]|nr:TonB-dependent receptor plug domain-containing protein [Bacteroidales bacterium]